MWLTNIIKVFNYNEVTKKHYLCELVLQNHTSAYVRIYRMIYMIVHQFSHGAYC